MLNKSSFQNRSDFGCFISFILRKKNPRTLLIFHRKGMGIKFLPSVSYPINIIQFSFLSYKVKKQNVNSFD